jgi:hypothetical protein
MRAQIKKSWVLIWPTSTKSNARGHQLKTNENLQSAAVKTSNAPQKTVSYIRIAAKHANMLATSTIACT